MSNATPAQVEAAIRVLECFDTVMNVKAEAHAVADAVVHASENTAEAKVARVEAAIRLLGNEDITPQGVRILRAALDAKEAQK